MPPNYYSANDKDTEHCGDKIACEFISHTFRCSSFGKLPDNIKTNYNDCVSKCPVD